MTSAREAELKYVREQNEQMIAKDRELAKIEINKFQQQIQAIGTDTIKSIATAGPDHQVRCRCITQYNKYLNDRLT